MSRRILALAAALFVVLPALSATRPLFDGDADGVSDERDSCLYSPRGVVVGPNGCSTPGDEDEDGVADASDSCPLSPAGAIVDLQGCALDGDSDGVADGIDACPASRANVRIDSRGCGPGDRVVALAPKRPRVAAAAPAPPVQPAAPAPMAPAPASTVAVPAATSTLPGGAAEAGPVLPSAVTTGALDRRAQPERTFYFDKGSSALSWAVSRAIKESAKDLLPKLEKNPTAGLIVSGHADTKSDGADAARLATARATAVRAALIDAGVPPQRLSVRVPGVNEPRFYGADLERNCRVELRVLTRLGTDSMPVVAAPPPAPAPAAVAPVAAPRATPTSKPAPVVTPVPVRAGTTAVAFAPYSAMLDDSAIGVLNRFVQDSTRPLLADAAARVVVVSGVDAGETGAAALRLAESRSASVMAYLVSLGLPRNRVELSNHAQTGTRRAELTLVGR